MPIHPTALVSPAARLGRDVSVGPFAVIEDDVLVGDRCVIEGSAQIRNGVEIGEDCFVGSGAILGSDPQIRGFDPTVSSRVVIGKRNVLREYVTVHRSSAGGGRTVLGIDNYLMAGAHIGHDSIVGDNNTLANDVLLGGHVVLGNHCFVGGGSAFHQFVRVGDYVMCQGHSGFSQDLPPFVIGADINIVVGINAVGMKRAGFSPEQRREVKEAFRTVYHSATPLETILSGLDFASISPAPRLFFEFLRGKSKKGLCIRSSRHGEAP